MEPQPASTAIQYQWLITTAIAAIGLLRPELTSLYDRFWKKGKRSIHTTGPVEIAFTGNGIQVAILGSLVGTAEDFYVHLARLRVVRLKDDAKKHLKWAAFRSVQLTGPYANAIEMPNVFRVSAGMPCSFHIVFADEQHQSEILEILKPLQAEFDTKMQTKLEGSQGIESADVQLRVKIAQDCAKKAYEELAPSQIYSTAIQKITRTLFWDPGDYKLILEFDVENTFGKKSSVKKELYIRLQEQDFDSLKINATKIADDSLGHADRNPQFKMLYVQCKESQLPQIGPPIV